MVEVSRVAGCVPKKMLRVLALALALLFLSPPPGVASKQCPPCCLCYGSSDRVDCHAKGLTLVPQGLPHGTCFLDLRDNKMAELPAYSFDRLWSLRILVLSNTGLQLLHNKVMQGVLWGAFPETTVAVLTIVVTSVVYLLSTSPVL